MDLSFLINNPIAGAVIGAVAGPAFMALYKAIGVAKYLKQGADGLGAYTGKRAAIYTKRIKDPALREQMAKDIKESPNNFDIAFDSAFDEEMAK